MPISEWCWACLCCSVGRRCRNDVASHRRHTTVHQRRVCLCVCLLASISLELHFRSIPKFLVTNASLAAATLDRCRLSTCACIAFKWTIRFDQQLPLIAVGLGLVYENGPAPIQSTVDWRWFRISTGFSIGFIFITHTSYVCCSYIVIVLLP